MRKCGVRRARAELHVLITVSTYALTVIVLRAILALTDFPQMGGGRVHIAHLLWGGLALSAGALVSLVSLAPWASMLAAVLSGGGMALFMDEVGKFTTRSGDYFSPIAAPLIYAFLLAIALGYLYLRRPLKPDPRREMHHGLEGVGQLLDRSLGARQTADLIQRLDMLSREEHDHESAQLVEAMLAFAAVQDPSPSLFERSGIADLVSSVRLRWRSFAGGSRARSLLVFVLLAGGAYELLVVSLPLSFGTALHGLLGDLLRTPASLATLSGLAERAWWVARIALEDFVGILALASGCLLASGRERLALGLAVAALAVDLLIVDLVVLYRYQFDALAVTILHYFVLLWVLEFRRSRTGERLEGLRHSQRLVLREEIGECVRHPEEHPVLLPPDVVNLALCANHSVGDAVR